MSSDPFGGYGAHVNDYNEQKKKVKLNFEEVE
jgi:transcription antitermination factor NusG